LEKSRFGTQGRQCNFRILWGDQIGIQDDESLFDAIGGSSSLVRTGAWYTLLNSSGEALGSKFQASKWNDRMKEDEFRTRVYEIMDEEVIYKFDKREGNASDFYEEEIDGSE
jgi:hypothetical protein